MGLLPWPVAAAPDTISQIFIVWIVTSAVRQTAAMSNRVFIRF